MEYDHEYWEKLHATNEAEFLEKIYDARKALKQALRDFERGNGLTLYQVPKGVPEELNRLIYHIDALGAFCQSHFEQRKK